jgi:WD40 repeat protein
MKQTGNCVQQWNLHSDFVKSLVLSTDGQYLFSGSSDKTIRKLNLATGSSEYWKGHTRGIEDLKVGMDSNTLWSASSDGTIRKWNIATGNCELVLNDHATSVYALHMEEDGFCSGKFLLVL